jgi:DNA-binding beta-propeller fold protein YncE
VITVFVTNPNVAGTRNATLTVTAAGAQNSPQSVNITVNTTPPPPALNVTPTSLTFNATVGAGNPAPQNITVQNTGGSPLSFNIVSSDNSLVTVTPTSGSLSGGSSTPVQVQVTTPNAAGTRNATLTITAPGAQNSPRTVTITVITTAPPTLSATPASLTFNAFMGGGNPPAQTLMVRNTGGGSFNFNIASSNNSLVTASPTNATLSGGQTSNVQVQVTNPNAVGTQNATLTVSAAGAQNSPVTISITVNVTAAPTGAFALAASSEVTVLGGIPTAGAVVTSTTTTGTTREIAVAPNGSVAVSLSRENSASVLRINNNTVTETRTFNLDGPPVAVAISPDSSFAVVVTETPVRLAFIRNLGTNPSITSVLLLQGQATARDIALANDGDTAVITSTATGLIGVTVVDGLKTATPVIRGQVRTGLDPRGVAVSGDNAFVVDMRNNNIVVVTNITSGTPTLAGSAITSGVGTSPRTIRLTPDESMAILTNQGSGDITIYRVNGRNLQQPTKLTVGTAPAGVAISSDGDTAIIGNSGDGTVSVIINLKGTPSVKPPVISGVTTEAVEQSLAFVP